MSDYKAWFTVTGDSVDSNVPEPATAAVTLAAGLLLIGLRRTGGGR